MPRIFDALARLMPRRTMRLAAAEDEKASRTGPLIALETLGRPVWTPRDYAAFAREGFMQNAVCYRAVRMISEAAASIPLLLYDASEEIEGHPLLDLVRQPSVGATGTDLLEAWYGYLLVSGNAYLEAVAVGGRLRELHALRPDRMKVVPGSDGWPEAYEYTAGGETVRFSGEVVAGVRPILHVRLFHPANDHYGMSPIEAAATAIDIHNAAAKWNKALLDNSARPSGALVYAGRDGRMTAEQFERLKAELETSYQGSRNAGRPLLLEGGLDWKALSLSPKDMDFIEAKHAAAREIALALGVPPMLLGIPGDNTYSNYQEAQRAFWRGTVLPLVHRTAKALSAWLAPAFVDASGGSTLGSLDSAGPLPRALELRPDLDQVEGLSGEREALWARLDAATFLTANEKREAAGYDALEDAEPASGGSTADDGQSRRADAQGRLPFAEKYRPDQPRAPRGDPEGGQWVDEGGGGGRSGVGAGVGIGGVARVRKPEGDVNQTGGRGKLLKDLFKALVGQKPKKAPDFLVKKPKAGKISGKLDELTPDERRFAEEMRDLGNDVELVPRGPGRTADFKFDGKVYEYKKVSQIEKTDSDGLSGRISSRIMDGRGQAPDIIVDSREQAGMTREIAERATARAFGRDNQSGSKIDSITILTKDGPVHNLRQR